MSGVRGSSSCVALAELDDVEGAPDATGGGLDASVEGVDEAAEEAAGVGEEEDTVGRGSAGCFEQAPRAQVTATISKPVRELMARHGSQSRGEGQAP